MMNSNNKIANESNENEFDLEREVTHIIHNLGVPGHIPGYQYLRTAIMLVFEDSDIINYATKVLYPSIASKYQTTASRVQGAIRKAIEIAWETGDVDVLNAYFGHTIQSYRGKPTPTEFIAMIADHLRVKELNDPMVTNVTNILHQFGFPADIEGHNYLRDAILSAIKDSYIINSVTNVLYSSIASKYQTTTSCVDRAICRAIEVAWDRGDVHMINSYFSYTIANNRGRPTDSEFIAMIADKIRLEMKAC